MKKSLISLVTGTVLLAGAGIASAQTTTATTTTTWTNDQGAVIREYSTAQKYKSWDDPAYKVTVGSTLPGQVAVYPLPEKVMVPGRETYSYSIVNSQPVIVERASRRIVHVWDKDPQAKSN